MCTVWTDFFRAFQNWYSQAALNQGLTGICRPLKRAPSCLFLFTHGSRRGLEEYRRLRWLEFRYFALAFCGADGGAIW